VEGTNNNEEWKIEPCKTELEAQLKEEARLNDLIKKKLEKITPV
jgi:DNA gyrase/topoisomerase IV subunit A